MRNPCDALEPFVDGDLSAEERRAFEEHLAGCSRCEAGLVGLLQLEQFGRRYVERHGPPEVPWYALPRYRWGAAGAALLAGAMVLSLVLWWSPRAQESAAIGEWTVPMRSSEWRVTYRAADKHRRLLAGMGSESSMGPASVSRSPGMLAELEKRGDLEQLVAVYLALGKPDPEAAEAILRKMQAENRGDPADILCDLGVASLAEGKLGEALRLLDEALRQRPGHRQSLWNRGLVYERIGLPLLARQDFEALERIEPEADWREEAHRHVVRSNEALERRKRWSDADRAGDSLIAKEPGAIENALRFADVPGMRRDFYEAVRTRTSEAEVRALLPLAQRLDGMAGGGTVLADYVRRVASGNFARRAPLARQYARFVQRSLSDREQRALVDAVLASPEEDLALGALVRIGVESEPYATAFYKLASAHPDPWFRLLAYHRRAEALADREQYVEALAQLERASELCRGNRLFYRCTELEADLAFVQGWLFQLDDAARHAQAGLDRARQTGQWDQECMLLQTQGNLSRLRFDVALGRAYYGEALLCVGRNPLLERNIHQALAHLAIRALDLDGARGELDRALDVGLPLTIHGAEALVDVARTRRSPRDAEALKRALAAARTDRLGQRAYARFLRGRFLIDVEPEQGKALLEESIREADSAPDDDIQARHARAYSYTSLIFADAARGDFDAALRRFGAERGFEVPGQCVLALTEDTERSLILARGLDGRLLQSFEPNRRHRFPMDDLTDVLPVPLVEALRPCERVEVLARAPLQGRLGVLPADVAWSYRTQVATPRPRVDKPLHLVVNEVQYGGRNVRSLHWTPSLAEGEPVRWLQGLEATPSRVLEAMRDATDIDLATHGFISPASNASYLLLAHDVDGSDELREQRIRHARLDGAPLVVLAACVGARGGTALHEASSLPNALLEAGARAVIAVSVDNIPDQESAAFFAAVREQIRAGAKPAVAVRDQRVAWKREGKGLSWIGGVLVFE